VLKFVLAKKWYEDMKWNEVCQDKTQWDP